MDPLREIGRLLLIFGGVLAAAGALMMLGPRLPFRLGRLPGDIIVQGRNTSFYFPVVSCLLVSAAVTAIFWILTFLRR
jgi:hypothetical protein